MNRNKFHKKPLPRPLSDRIIHACSCSPLNKVVEALGIEIRDYMSQKLSILYIADIPKDEALNRICDYFGIERPGK